VSKPLVVPNHGHGVAFHMGIYTNQGLAKRHFGFFFSAFAFFVSRGKGDGVI
jgi:hypothetical protein